MKLSQMLLQTEYINPTIVTAANNKMFTCNSSPAGISEIKQNFNYAYQTNRV